MRFKSGGLGCTGCLMMMQFRLQFPACMELSTLATVWSKLEMVVKRTARIFASVWCRGWAFVMHCTGEQSYDIWSTSPTIKSLCTHEYEHALHLFRVIFLGELRELGEWSTLFPLNGIILTTRITHHYGFTFCFGTNADLVAKWMGSIKMS